MKKIILLLIVAAITFSCTSNDDNNSENTNIDTLNPPAWIIGTWAKTDASYTFTQDDLKYTSGGTTTSLKEKITEFEKNNNTSSDISFAFSEASTDQNYSVKCTLGDTKLTFSFTKKSNTVITSDDFLEGTYSKQ